MNTSNVSVVIDSRMFTNLRDLRPHFRKNRPKGVRAELIVESILRTTRGEVLVEPSLSDGKTPDFVWNVNPEMDGSYIFTIEVFYGYSTQQVINRIKTDKGVKYTGTQSNPYVVAIVHEDAVDARAVMRAGASSVKMHLSVGLDGVGSSTEFEVIPGEFADVNCSLLWFIPYLGDELENLKTDLQMHVMEVNGDASAELFMLNICNGDIDRYREACSKAVDTPTPPMI